MQRPISPKQIFLVFSHLSMMGFGGVLPWAWRILVERRKVLTPEDFREQFAYAQLFPGPTICNLAVMVGYREAGVRGGMAALAGMLGLPCLTVCTLWVLLRHFGHAQLVEDALRGMSAVAAGLVAATSLKLARTLAPTWRNLLCAGLMVAGMAVLRLPLLLLIVVLVPVALLFMRTGRESGVADPPPSGGDASSAAAPQPSAGEAGDGR